jgi:hypothetical protein
VTAIASAVISALGIVVAVRLDSTKRQLRYGLVMNTDWHRLKRDRRRQHMAAYRHHGADDECLRDFSQAQSANRL